MHRNGGTLEKRRVVLGLFSVKRSGARCNAVCIQPMHERLTVHLGETTKVPCISSRKEKGESYSKIRTRQKGKGNLDIAFNLQTQI